MVWAAACAWYDMDELSDACDQELLLERIVSEHPKHEGIFTELFRGLTKVSTNNILDMFLEFKIKTVSNQLVQALAAGDRRRSDELADVFRQLNTGQLELRGTGKEVYTGVSSEQLVDAVRPENMIKLYPRALNDAVGGGVPRGAHILVFAPPEVGKSMLCINMAAGFLHDGRRVLYVGNEDPAKLMLLRFKSRLSGMTREQILENPRLADERAEARGFNNLVFVGMSPGTIRDVGGLCDEHKPDVVLVDQISNLHTPNLNKVEALEWVAKQMRNLCKARDILGVSVTQAADSAIGKGVLEMGDVYFSNIAIQAQVDVMIGIGMDNVMQAAGIRMLSLCKNKLSGNHQPVQVTVEPRYSRVTA